jgi:hypothetical protein
MLAIRGKKPPEEPAPAKRTIDDVIKDRQNLDRSYWKLSEALNLEYEQLIREKYD